MPDDDDYVRKITRQVASGTLTLTIESEKQKKKFWKKRGPRLPAPRHPNQQTLAKLAEQQFEARYSDEKVLRIVTTSGAWDVASHRWTGEPVRRSLRAIAMTENKEDGRCRAVFLTLHQDHAGGGEYEKGVRIEPGQATLVPCAIE